METNLMNSLFFTNLQILGIDIDFMEGTYKIPFQKDMFNLPNKAGSEAVLHFLFTRLNPLLAKEQFRDCWPIIDKNSELQFRKVCNIWLTQIQDEPDAHLPRINGSLFLTPGGRKFIYVVYSFSTYVMIQVMKTEHNWKNQVYYPDFSLNVLTRLSIAALNDYTVKECYDFFDKLHLSVALNRRWKHYASELVKEHRKMKKRMRERESEKKFLEKQMLEVAVKHYGEKVLSISTCLNDYYSEKQMQRISLALKYWKSISVFYDNLKSKREIIQSVVDNRFSKYILDATVMGIKVPNLLLQESSKIFLDVHKTLKLDNLYSEGCLNLVTVLLLWTICLNIYKECLLIEKLPKFALTMPVLSNQVQKHLIHVKTTKELRDDVIKKTLQSLSCSVDVLKKKCIKRSKSIFLQNVNLGLITPTKKYQILSPATLRLESSNDLKTATVQGPIASFSQDIVLPVTSPVLETVCTNQVLSLPTFSKRSLKDSKKDKVTSFKLTSKEKEGKIKEKRTFLLKQKKIETNIIKFRKDQERFSFSEMLKNTKHAEDFLVDEVVDSVLNNTLNTFKETEEKIGGLIPLRPQEIDVNCPTFQSKTHNLEDVKNILSNLNIEDTSQTSLHVVSSSEPLYVNISPESLHVNSKPESVHNTESEAFNSPVDHHAFNQNVQKNFSNTGMLDKISIDLFHLSPNPTGKLDISSTGKDENGVFMSFPGESFAINCRTSHSSGTQETYCNPNLEESYRSIFHIIPPQLSPFTDQLNDFIHLEDERPDCLIENEDVSAGSSSFKTIQEKLLALRQKASDILNISFDSSASSDL